MATAELNECVWRPHFFRFFVTWPATCCCSWRRGSRVAGPGSAGSAQPLRPAVTGRALGDALDAFDALDALAFDLAVRLTVCDGTRSWPRKMQLEQRS